MRDDAIRNLYADRVAAMRHPAYPRPCWASTRHATATGTPRAGEGPGSSARCQHYQVRPRLSVDEYGCRGLALSVRNGLYRPGPPSNHARWIKCGRVGPYRCRFGPCSALEPVRASTTSGRRPVYHSPHDSTTRPRAVVGRFAMGHGTLRTFPRQISVRFFK